jgi:tRNA (adenine22-N1)-methyltransferase
MLSERLQTLVGCVEKAGVAADIGCDHGYAAKGIIEEGRAKKVISCDISARSLEKAEKLVVACGLGGVCETRLGDGLAPLEMGEADVIIIAGMGGLQIEKIISGSEAKAKNADMLVLSPNRNETELRKYLLNNGFAITDEKLALDGGRYYQVICARAGGEVAEEDGFYYVVGRKLIEKKDRHLEGFLKRELSKIDFIVAGASNGRGQERYIAGLVGIRERMEKVLECL